MQRFQLQRDSFTSSGENIVVATVIFMVISIELSFLLRKTVSSSGYIIRYRSDFTYRI